MVLYQGFYGFAGARALLDFVEDDERFARYKMFFVMQLDVLQQRVYILQVLIELLS